MKDVTKQKPLRNEYITQDKAHASSLALSLAGIHAGYGKKQILQGVDWDIRAGSFAVIVGPNGAGKSTLLKTVMGLISSSQGSIRYNGKDITRYPIQARVQCGLSYLIQGGEVFASLTVRENLEMAALTASPEERAETLEEILGLFPDLRAGLSRQSGLLSGGQRQQLAVGMVMSRRPHPAMFLLDEPFAGLGPAVAHRILHHISELVQSRHVTVLLVEQRAREALQSANHAVFMKDGQIAAETDNPREWLEEGKLWSANVVRECMSPDQVKDG